MDGKGSPQEKLNQVLDSHLGLDPLYTAQVFSNAYHDDVFHKVLLTIICIHEQLSITDLTYLLELPSEAVVDCFIEIQSIIKIPADNRGSVQFNHASFRDFLVDKLRSKDYCLPSSWETFIVIRSMTIMVKVFKRDEWPNGGAKEYACNYWCIHLDGVISGCTLKDLGRDMLEILQMFTRCDAVEVWINYAIRDNNINETLWSLSDIKSLLQV